MLVTAAIYGIFTEWGFAKYHWIVAKIVVIAAILATVLFGLSLAINGMASIADANLNTPHFQTQYSNFMSRAIISAIICLVLFVFLFIVSVLKPWGKTRWIVKQKTKIAVVLSLILIAMGYVTYAEGYSIKSFGNRKRM